MSKKNKKDKFLVQLNMLKKELAKLKKSYKVMIQKKASLRVEQPAIRAKKAVKKRAVKKAAPRKILPKKVAQKTVTRESAK